MNIGIMVRIIDVFGALWEESTNKRRAIHKVTNVELAVHLSD